MDGLNTNPVSHTALVTLDFLRKTDIPYAEAFAGLFGIDDMHAKEAQKPTYVEYHRRVAPRIELRIKGSDYFLRTLGNAGILDIACGFTPRGVYMAEAGFDYVGADLPFVIGQMKPKVEGLLAQMGDLTQHIHYEIADVTDGNQLERAAAHLTGPLTVTCEGMLGYMPAYEQKEVAKNIYRVLSQHGGAWITPDFNSQLASHENEMINFVLGGVTDKPMPDSVKSTPVQTRAMLQDVGFTIRDVVFSPEPEEITSLRFLKEDEYAAFVNDQLICPFMVMRCAGGQGNL